MHESAMQPRSHQGKKRGKVRDRESVIRAAKRQTARGDLVPASTQVIKEKERKRAAKAKRRFESFFEQKVENVVLTTSERR